MALIDDTQLGYGENATFFVMVWPIVVIMGIFFMGFVCTLRFADDWINGFTKKVIKIIRKRDKR